MTQASIRPAATGTWHDAADPVTVPVTPQGAPARPAVVEQHVVYMPKRSKLPGLIGAGIIGAAVAALAVSNFYDPRPVGQKLDEGVAAANGAAADAAQAGDKVAAALGDAGITAAVKTALAADPALSALKIEVSTREGVVHLEGPAPDEKAKERAAVLASAPKGVVSVENGLVVTQSSQVN